MEVERNLGKAIHMVFQAWEKVGRWNPVKKDWIDISYPIVQNSISLKKKSRHVSKVKLLQWCAPKSVPSYHDEISNQNYITTSEWVLSVTKVFPNTSETEKLKSW